MPNSSDETFEILNINVVETIDKYDTVAERAEHSLNPADKNKLLRVFRDVDNMAIEPTNDGYTVKVHLKNDIVFSHGSRRFSYSERLDLRKIIDNLQKRNIIKPCISSYCSRVILVSKKNGDKRMCVDLRPHCTKTEVHVSGY